MTQANGLNNEVDDEVGGGGDGLSGTALALVGPTSATEAPPFVIDCNLVPPPTKAQLLQEKHQLFLDCLLPIWHKDTFIPVRLSEDYSDKAHLSAIATAIEFSKTVQETESQFDHDSSDSDDDYGCVQNPSRAMIVSNKFLKVLPECPPIHWPSHMFNDPQLCFCPCSTNIKPWREKTKVSIHPNHRCKSKNMTPNQLINHLKNKEDSTHKAILVYLTKLASFQ